MGMHSSLSKNYCRQGISQSEAHANTSFG